MFQRTILQHVWLQYLWLRYMLGFSGLSNLGKSHQSVHYLYINMTPGPHRLRISAFSLFTLSIHPLHHPQPIADTSPPIYIYIQDLLPLSALPPYTIEKSQTIVLNPNVFYFCSHCRLFLLTAHVHLLTVKERKQFWDKVKLQ